MTFVKTPIDRPTGANALAALLLAACWALGGTLPACAETPLSGVLSAVTLSFKGDGSRDRAVLVAGDDGEADLYVYLGLPDDAAERAKMKPTLVKRNVAFAGPMFGQEASLSANSKGSLVLGSMNEAIGRDKWTEKLTIAWRKDALAVVGITYRMHDGLDPNGGGSCDLNLLSGKGLRNGKPVAGPAAPVPLADWDNDHLPEACRF